MPGPSRTNGSERDRLSEALDQLAQRPQRDDQGRFTPGNSAAVKSGARSDGFWRAIGGVKQETLHRLRSDLALDRDIPTTLEALLDAFAEATLLRRSLFLRLARSGGAITSRGRSRAAFNAYLAVADRERRLALDLGLERRQKPLPSLEEVMAGE